MFWVFIAGLFVTTAGLAVAWLAVLTRGQGGVVGSWGAVRRAIRWPVVGRLWVTSVVAAWPCVSQGQ